VLAATFGFVGYKYYRFRNKRKKQPALRDIGCIIKASLRGGMEEVLPLILAVTFLLVPSTSTRIFKTFLCDRFAYDDSGQMRRFLHDDLRLSCDQYEYTLTRYTAQVALALWPIGVPVLYFLLLWASKDAILTGKSTKLSSATAFLWGDYQASAWWWEYAAGTGTTAVGFTPRRIQNDRGSDPCATGRSRCAARSHLRGGSC
jgi:hypothetical protein